MSVRIDVQWSLTEQNIHVSLTLAGFSVMRVNFAVHVSESYKLYLSVRVNCRVHVKLTLPGLNVSTNWLYGIVGSDNIQWLAVHNMNSCILVSCSCMLTVHICSVGHNCSQQEVSGPAGLPKSVEEVWRREWIVIWMWCRYVWLLSIRCSIAILFTCMLVLAVQLAREGAHVKHEMMGKTARYWVGQDKQEWYMWNRAGKRLSLIRGRGHDRCIREVLQEDSCSSMYRVYGM
jgi:hypothetical protein